MTLTVGSLFSGVGGFEMGFERAGFRVAWQCEIDPDATSVLERHWPDVSRYRDVSEVDPADLEPVDVLIFGSPCQGFSVAGRGAGLDDERSGLFGEAIRIIRGIRPTVAVWENVPGAYSANDGRDFGAVLAALAESGALDISWRVLDAQWFGVPQRRRRIFLVADFGGERAAQVLFESSGVPGDSQTSGAAGQGVAGDAEAGAGSGGVAVASESGPGWWRDGFGCLRAEGENRPSRPSHVVHETAFTLTASGRHTGDGHGNAWNSNYIPEVAGDGVRDAVTCHQAKGGDPTTDNYVVDVTNGRECSGDAGTLTTELAHGNRGQMVVANAVTVSAGHHGHSSPRGDGSDNLIAFTNRGVTIEGAHETLRAASHGALPMVSQAAAIYENVRSELRESDQTNALTGGGGKPGQGYAAARIGTAVRRLTPVECERLQGWPDDHTRYRADGREIADGPRYRMIGNGVATPVAEWIAHRLRAALEASA